MNVEISIDPRKALETRGFLTAMAEKQIPFALSNALNSTVLDVQRAEVNRQHSIFTVRRPDWLKRSNKIVHFANKRELWAMIGIHPPGATGKGRSDVVGKFETDTEKRAIEGRTVAVPVAPDLKRDGTGIIPRRNRPRGFNFRRRISKGRKQVHGTPDARGIVRDNVVVGDRGTFIVRKADGSGLILQRTGKGRGRKGKAASKGSVRVLYYLALRARLKPNLQFVETAGRVVETRFNQHMLREFDKAMRTAK